MRSIWRADRVRAAEQATGPALASGQLMARAAAGLARAVWEQLAEAGSRPRRARLLVLAGPGDNGGDGLYAGARLARRGLEVWLWNPLGKVHQAAWRAAVQAGARALSEPPTQIELAGFDLVLDAVFGLGARPGLPPQVAELAQACRRLGRPVLSVDLPSGLAADSNGADQPDSFWAARTVALGAWKPCHVQQPARQRCGARSLVEIGLELDRPDLVEVELPDLAAWWPRPQPTSDKYSRGVVGFDTGSEAYPGAGVLGVLGAIWSGAGLVRHIGPVGPAVLAAAPNVICQSLEQAEPAWPGLIPTEQSRPQAGLARIQVQAWVIGSGWGDRPGLAARLDEAVATGRPVVVDADALRVGLSGLVEEPTVRPLDQSVLLTPHAGELADCLGWERRRVEADPVAATHRLSDLTGATVLLKGATQYVARPGLDTTYLGLPGPAWTAQAGSGDVLAGICGTLLAAGLPAWRAALAAASIQALAAVRHPGPYPPQALVRHLPSVIASLDEFVPPDWAGPVAEEDAWT